MMKTSNHYDFARSLFSIALILVFFLFLNSCKTTNPISEGTLTEAAPIEKLRIPDNKLSGGSSGMVKYGPSDYLAVYDLKIFQDGVRISRILTSEEDIKIIPIEISDWKSEEGKPSDFESVCRVPGTTHEFLATESGNWEGNLGRIFHISIDSVQNTGTVLGVIKMPVYKINKPGQTGDQIEGTFCYMNSEDELVMLLAERGGSAAYPNGIIRWGNLDLENYSLSITEEGKKGKMVMAPGIWQKYNEKRSITDLHVNENNEIWAAASEDLGDQGPFYSVIYRLGRIQETEEAPIITTSSYRLWVEMNGLKIEALASAPASVKLANLSFGSEDEIYGGVWRPILIE